MRQKSSNPLAMSGLAAAAVLATLAWGGAASAAELEASRGGATAAPQLRAEAQDCLEELQGVLEPEESVIPFLPQDRTLNTLSQAATIFAQNGQADSCEEVVDGIEHYIDIRQERLQERGEKQALTMEERLRQAAPVGTTGPWRASDLMGSDVLGPNGTFLGEVDDVVVAPDGTTRFALLGRGGFLGLDEELIPIEVSQLRVVDEHTLMVPIGAEALGNAPRYDEEEIRQPGIVDRWSDEVAAWWDENLPAE